MAHREYLIRYSNGFKRHVSKTDLDLLGSAIQQVGPREYLCTVSLQMDLEQTNGPHYLSGSFIFEHGGQRTRDLMESTIGMISRYRKNGVLA